MHVRHHRPVIRVGKPDGVENVLSDLLIAQRRLRLLGSESPSACRHFDCPCFDHCPPTTPPPAMSAKVCSRAAWSCSASGCSTRSSRAGSSSRTARPSSARAVLEFNFADKSSAGLRLHFPGGARRFRPPAGAGGERARARGALRSRITAVDSAATCPRSRARSRGRREVHRPRFVLDACGFGRTLPNCSTCTALGLPAARRDFLPREDDSSRMRSTGRRSASASIDDHEVWSWLIPFSNGNTSLGVVSSVEHMARAPAPSRKSSGAMSAEPGLHELLSAAQTVRPVGEIIGYSATSLACMADISRCSATPPNFSTRVLLGRDDRDEVRESCRRRARPAVQG